MNWTAVKAGIGYIRAIRNTNTTLETLCHAQSQAQATGAVTGDFDNAWSFLQQARSSLIDDLDEIMDGLDPDKREELEDMGEGEAGHLPSDQSLDKLMNTTATAMSSLGYRGKLGIHGFDEEPAYGLIDFTYETAYPKIQIDKGVVVKSYEEIVMALQQKEHHPNPREGRRQVRRTLYDVVPATTPEDND